MPTCPVAERDHRLRRGRARAHRGSRRGPRPPAACECGCASTLRLRPAQRGRDHGSWSHTPTPLHVRPCSPIVRDHPFIIRDHNKCISCGRCVAACAEIEGPGVLAFQFHERPPHRRHPATACRSIETDCVSCGQCVTACPCGALDYVRERGRRCSRRSTTRPRSWSGSSPRPSRSVIAPQYGIPFDEASPFIAGLMRADRLRQGVRLLLRRRPDDHGGDHRVPEPGRAPAASCRSSPPAARAG